MDTTTVPEFKIAKVGKERKRKGAGLPFFGGGSSGGGVFSGAVGGSGAGVAGGMGLLGKIGILALIGTLSAGAWQVGAALRPDDTSGSGAKPKLFADGGHKYSDEDLANVIRSNNGVMPNSVGYVKGSLDGMTPEERAKKEAEAAEAARLAEEEAKKAEEEANKESSDVAGSPAGMDPNGLMQGVNDKKDDKGAFGKKFGTLSSSFGGGGGLAGGSGLAGGVTRGFSNATLNNKGTSGKMASMRGGSNPSISKGAKARPGRSNNKGFARRQLGNAHNLSRQATTAGKGETSAQTASTAFDNNNGAGNVISGPGVGAGNGGAGVDAGGSVNPNTSGPINSDDETSSDPTPTGKNATKYQNLVMAGQMLLMLVAVIAVIAMVMEKSIVGTIYAQILKFLIAALGAAILAVGAAILKQEPLIGKMYIAAGGMVIASAFVPDMLTSAPTVMYTAAGALISSAVGLLGGMMGNKKGSSGAMN